MATVTLDEDLFRSIFPAFSDENKFSSEVLTYWFGQACEIVGNDDTSPIPYDPDTGVVTRQGVLFAVLCHLLTINYLWETSQAGALTSATEGSVSAGFAVNASNPDWWNQTKCGAQAWFVLSRYAVGGEYYGIKYFHENG